MRYFSAALLVVILTTPLGLAQTSGAHLAPGRFGKALDARQGRVEVSGHTDFDGPPLSVECWAKLFDKRSSNILVAKDTKASSRHWEIFTVADSGHFTAYLPGYTPDHVGTGVDVVDGKWHHLAMTHDGTRVKLYIDGKLKADAAVKAQARFGPPGLLAIGGLVEGTLRCNGLIDEVHISKTARTFDGLPKSAPQPDRFTVGLWHFDTDEAGRFDDASSANRRALVVSIPQGTTGKPPRSLDDRLTIELFAKEPDIVTPIGIAVDRNGRLLVLESNTHFPPKGYKRHPSDRVWILEDTNDDGKADKFTLFADGFTAGMHITAHPDGAIYLVSRSSVVRLRDTDGDGKADKRETLMRLETKCTYPHNGLFSCAFDWQNRMYVSMGENLGDDYTLRGSDGSTVKGGGEGGNIFRATADGGKVERIATGFWNPVQLHFDIYGRLFTIDNDPDGRPPCRLIHVVGGGDYGYRYRNGRPGLHPFTAWNGELPGTLPMVAGTGEAPSGLLTVEHGILPNEYRGDMLVTSWGDYRIDLFRLARRSASFRATSRPLIVGGEDFRPVGMAAAPDGSIYVTDWVDKSYETHGRGRVWRIRAKGTSVAKAKPAPQVALMHEDRNVREEGARQLSLVDPGRHQLRRHAREHADPRVRAAALGGVIWSRMRDDDFADKLRNDPSADVRELAARQLPLSGQQLIRLAANDRSPAVQAAALERVVLKSGDAAALKLVLEKLTSDDPFIQAAAREALRRSPDVLAKIDLHSLTDPKQQLGVLLALRAVGSTKAVAELPHFLKSADPLVRFVTVQWIGEERLKQHRAALVEHLTSRDLSGDLFAATLTALALVDGAGYAEAAKGGQVYVERILTDPKSPTSLKAQALRRLDPASKILTLDRLKSWIANGESALQLEALRTLRETPHAERYALLASVAEDKKFPAQLRAEAAAALGDDPSDRWRGLLVKLSGNSDGALRAEALRSLRGHRLTKPERETLKKSAEESVALQPLVYRVLQPDWQEKLLSPTNTDAWLKLLSGPADAAAGERIFFHAKSAGCYRCHRHSGRGSDIGPDLTLAAQTLDRRRLVESILQPSKEIAPQYTPWAVATNDGKFFAGVLVREDSDGYQTYADSTGTRIRVHYGDIQSRQAGKQSIMPDDLVKTLTVQEFRDLLAFLEGGERKAAPAIRRE